MPDWRDFLTLEERRARARALAAQFPDLARLETVGASAEGRPIELLTVGHGRTPALLVGVPHPNEPIGTLYVPCEHQAGSIPAKCPHLWTLSAG